MRTRSFCTVMFFAILSWCIVVSVDNVVDGFNLEIISTLPYNISVGSALQWTGAAFQLALDDVRSQFPFSFNVTLTLLYTKNERTTCEDAEADAPRLLADYYYNNAQNRCVVVIAGACGGLYSLPDFVKVSTTAFNPIRGSTSVGMIGSTEGLCVALLKLCRFFKWMHITVLTDSSATTDFYVEMDRGTKKLAMLEDYLGFQVDGFNFIPTNNRSMTKALTRASQRSRVFLILAHTLVVIKLLRTAKEQKIVTFGEYVFIVMQPLQQSIYGRVSLLNDPHDQDVDLFCSVIYLTITGLMGYKADELNKKLVERELTDYGTVFERGIKPFDLYSIRETYNSLQLAATLVNESKASTNEHQAEPSRVCGGKRLKSLMLNRTFAFPSGIMHFQADGSRDADLLLYTFNYGQKKMQVAARYESASQKYLWIPNVTNFEWHSGGPPLDIPLCGFSGLEGPCKTQDATSSVVLTFFVATFLLAGFLTFRKTYKEFAMDRKWWRLSEMELKSIL